MSRKWTTWQDVLTEFILQKRAEGLAWRTLDDYEDHITRFFSRCHVEFADYEALRRAVLAYLAEPVAPATRNIRLSNLKIFFRWCVDNSYLPDNPCTGIKKSRDDGTVRHLSLEEVKQLLRQPDRSKYTGLRDYCMILLQLDTGIRPGEMCQLLPGDVNLEAREIYIRPGVAKTRIGRTLPFSPTTAAALARLLKVRPTWWSEKVPLFASEQGNPLTSWWWSKQFKKYSEQAGVRSSPYCLRHTAAIEFLRHGADAFSVQRMLGHTDLTMTKRYVNICLDDLKTVHDKASPVQALFTMDKRASRKLD
ncbi:MAG: tyrosine-type recombinase/integrase [Firmicutes bacterium]|nr:tyrosine-type recombinase/integrase [Bacillota bacterium]